jgi:hypothetical protein
VIRVHFCTCFTLCDCRWAVVCCGSVGIHYLVLFFCATKYDVPCDMYDTCFEHVWPLTNGCRQLKHSPCCLAWLWRCLVCSLRNVSHLNSLWTIKQGTLNLCCNITMWSSTDLTSSWLLSLWFSSSCLRWLCCSLWVASDRTWWLCILD